MRRSPLSTEWKAGHLQKGEKPEGGKEGAWWFKKGQDRGREGRAVDFQEEDGKGGTKPVLALRAYLALRI